MARCYYVVKQAPQFFVWFFPRFPAVLIYVKSTIASKELDSYKVPEKLEGIFIEVNLRKTKLLFFGGYRSDHPQYGIDVGTFLSYLEMGIDKYNSYEKFLVAGDFNIPDTNEKITDFMEDLDSKCLVKEPTCFKSLENPSKIYLFISNSPLSFQRTCAIDTGLSDFHRMIITVLKSSVPKSQPRYIMYRRLKNIDDEFFEQRTKKRLEELTEKIMKTLKKLFWKS